MPAFECIYVVITGASTARRVPELLPEIARLGLRIVVLMTPNSHRVVAPREIVLALQGVPDGAGAQRGTHQVVESYFDAALGPPLPPGILLVAPCTFDSLNKLAAGIADNLALSVAAEAIGRRWPALVAISLNDGLWEHPRSAQSMETLRSWGVELPEPHWVDGGPRLADTKTLVQALRRHLDSGQQSVVSGQ